MNNDKIELEKRTLEQLFKDLREEKNWSYYDIVSELTKLGTIVDEKKVKRWEYGLEYPSIEEIYILSELYFIPSASIIMAKNNSYKKGLDSIHMTFIKWFCYFSGVSFKAMIIIMYLLIAFALVGAFCFFINQANHVKDLNWK